MGTEKNVNHSNESVVEIRNVDKPLRRKRIESPYLKIRSKATNIFRNQIDKSVKTKKLAFERAFSKEASSDYTKNRFLAEFKENVDMLLDSKRFDKDCESNNLIPFNAATHIAFDGTSKIDAVLKKGLIAIYYTRLTELAEPLFDEKELNEASTVRSSSESQE